MSCSPCLTASVNGSRDWSLVASPGETGAVGDALVLQRAATSRIAGNRATGADHVKRQAVARRARVVTEASTFSKFYIFSSRRLP